MGDHREQIFVNRWMREHCRSLIPMARFNTDPAQYVYTVAFDGTLGICNEIGYVNNDENIEMQVREYTANPNMHSGDPQGKSFDKGTGAYLSLDELFLARSFESDEVDEPAGGGHASFASFGIGISSRSHLEKILEQEKTSWPSVYPSNVDVDFLLGSEFLYNPKYKELRKKIAFLFRKDQEFGKKKQEVGVYGPHINDKFGGGVLDVRFWHGFADVFFGGKVPYQAEFPGYDRSQAILLHFSPYDYALATAEQLQSLVAAESDELIIWLKDGDGSVGTSDKKRTSEDDIMGIFSIRYSDLIQTSESYVYTQTNSLGGTDWGLKLSYRKP
ncbi:MAG: hypothetical protein R3A11_00955 [Bdellovibrionota bacterium]